MTKYFRKIPILKVITGNYIKEGQFLSGRTYLDSNQSSIL